MYNFQPLLTRAEIYKISVTHYFKPDKARDELGYRPLVSMKTGMDRVVQYYKDKERTEGRKSSSGGSFRTLALIVGGILLCYLFYLFF